MSLLPFFYFHLLDSNLSIASKYYPKKIHLVNLVIEQAKANVMAKVVVEFKGQVKAKVMARVVVDVKAKV